MRTGLLVASWVVGCSEASDDSRADRSDPADAWPAAVEIGTGSVGYVPLADGDPVGVVRGPQSGYHVTVGARVTGMTETVWVRVDVFHAATGERLNLLEVQEEFLALAEFDEATCTGVVYGFEAFLDLTADEACALAGETLDVVVTVGNFEDDTVLERTATVVAALDPSAAAYCE